MQYATNDWNQLITTLYGEWSNSLRNLHRCKSTDFDSLNSLWVLCHVMSCNSNYAIPIVSHQYIYYLKHIYFQDAFYYCQVKYLYLYIFIFQPNSFYSTTGVQQQTLANCKISKLGKFEELLTLEITDVVRFQDFRHRNVKGELLGRWVKYVCSSIHTLSEIE